MKARDVAGKRVVVTGTFTGLSRADAEAGLARLGAIVSRHLTSKTNILFVGKKPGSKLAKAKSLGVATRSEQALRDLLTRAPESVAPAAMPGVAKELRAAVQALKKRPDVRVDVADLGRPARATVLAQLTDVPAELVDFYAVMNGVHVEWEFIEPPGGGCIRVPPVSESTRFTGDDDTFMGFGDGCEALLFDEIQPEGATWLVRKRGKKDFRIVFASVGEGRDGIEAAGSIAAYLRAAMKSGFVHDWPRCFTGSKQVSYAAQEAALERFRASPVKPAKFQVGDRVDFGYFAERGRGELLERYRAPPSDTTEFCGRELAKVRLDEGSVAWLPEKWMKVHRKRDAYEHMRDPSFDFGATARDDLEGLFAELARALGPVTHYSCGRASNARLGAGLLSARTYGDAVKAVLDVYDAAHRSRFDLDRTRKLTKTGGEFDPRELTRLGWEHTPRDTLIGLFHGILIRTCHESATHGVAARKLLDRPTMARLDAMPFKKPFGYGDRLHELATAFDERLEAPRWSYDDGGARARELGLSDGVPPFIGTGF